MLNFGSSHAEKRKSFRRIKDLIKPKFHEKMFKVSSNDKFNVAKLITVPIFQLVVCYRRIVCDLFVGIINSKFSQNRYSLLRSFFFCLVLVEFGL